MTKVILFFLSIVIGIALFIGVIVYIGLDDLVEVFSSFSWFTIAIVISLALLQITIIIYRWQMILEAQGDKVKFRQLLGPKFVGFAISYLTPGLYVGGEPVRAYLLKKQAKVPFTHGFASIIVDKILDFTYPLPFLIVALIYALFTYDISFQAVGVFIVALVGLVALLATFYIQTYRGKGFFTSMFAILRLDRLPKIQRILDRVKYFEGLNIEFFKKRRDIFIKGLLLSLLGGMIIFIQFMVMLWALGISANLIEILVMMVFMILAFLVPIPASLGSLEASQVLVFTALGHPASVGFAFTLILRIAELGKLGVGLAFLSNVGLKFLKEVPKENEAEN